MLILRPAQRQALQEACDRELVRRLVVHLQEHYPSRVAAIPTTALHRRVTRAVRTAHRHRMSPDSAVAGFVAFTFVAGPRFLLRPEIAGILSDTGAAGPERVRRLFRELEQSRPGSGKAHD
jgi:hypothetical protein